jgi:hypothetical protein
MFLDRSFDHNSEPGRSIMRLCPNVVKLSNQPQKSAPPPSQGQAARYPDTNSHMETRLAADILVQS